MAAPSSADEISREVLFPFRSSILSSSRRRSVPAARSARHGISSPQRHPCQIPLQSSPDQTRSFPGFIGSIDRLGSDTKSGPKAVLTTETGEVRAHWAADRRRDERDDGTRRRSHRAAVIWVVACLRTRESCSNVREQGMGHNDMGRRGTNEA